MSESVELYTLWIITSEVGSADLYAVPLSPWVRQDFTTRQNPILAAPMPHGLGEAERTLFLDAARMGRIYDCKFFIVYGIGGRGEFDFSLAVRLSYTLDTATLVCCVLLRVYVGWQPSKVLLTKRGL